MVQPVFDYLRCGDRFQADDHGRLLAAFHWQQHWPGSGMAWLATPLAATVFSRNACFEALALAGGGLGRVARIAADVLPQAGQLGSQGGELSMHQLILLTQHPNLFLLRKDQRLDTGWRHKAVTPEIPAGEVVNASSLVERGKREYACRQGLD